MKAIFQSLSQEEFDKKRPALIKAIGGSRLKVSIRDSESSRPTEAKEPVYLAQKETLESMDKDFKKMIEGLKADISEIIEE